jgi:adenine-specific DNA-methyltransferase
METIEKLDGKTLNLVKENISALKSLFPEAFSEEKIDFDKLRLLLGDEVETSSEKYSFNWHGKSEAIKLALKQSSGTLKPCVKDSKNWDTTKNLYIEGDNLEVLRILQGAYQNKVKMIYIDPPYNTGKDFVYKDSFKDNIKNYKEQVQESGKANPETAGRYHTNWLNMMYPRLKLARNLLRDDGVIFISIDDHEVHNLRKICDEIFGEENFVTQFVWKKKQGGGNDSNLVVLEHEYILLYAKNISVCRLNADAEHQLDDKLYPFEDDCGQYGLVTLDKSSIRFSNSLVFEITDLNGNLYKPRIVKGKQSCWRWSKKKVEKEFDKLVFKDGKVYTKYYRQDAVVPKSLLIDSRFGRTETGNDDIKMIFEDKLFSYPKPLALRIGLDHSDLILDFFSGSATTAHAVMKLNAEDGGNRRYIMVQLPEKTPEDHEARKAGYETIAEIGKERIRRAGEKIKEEFKDKEGIENLDIGFKVFKLDESNFTAWNTNTSDLTQTLSEMKNTIMRSSSPEDAFYEVLLKLGIDISLPVEEIDIKGKKIYSLAGHYVLACFDKNLSLEVIEEMARLSSETETIVVSDDVFKDNLTKLNAEETLKRNHVKFLRVV